MWIGGFGFWCLHIWICRYMYVCMYMYYTVSCCVPLHKHTTSFLLLMEECRVPGLAALRHHLVQLWRSVPVALLPISHGVLAGQQPTMLHTAPWSPFSNHTHIDTLKKLTKQWCHCIWRDITAELAWLSCVENNPSDIEAVNPQPPAHKSPTCSSVGTELHVCVYLKQNQIRQIKGRFNFFF